MTRNVTVGKLRNTLSKHLNSVAYSGARYIVERHGKSVAALVSVQDLELIRATEDQVDLQAAGKALRKGGTITWDDVRASLGI